MLASVAEPLAVKFLRHLWYELVVKVLSEAHTSAIIVHRVVTSLFGYG